MTQELSKTLVSKSALEEANRALKSEISGRKRVEEEQQKALRGLRDVNRLMTGREQRVMELKKQINELRAELGRVRRYQTTA
jgi:chromosome segregation ATPase